MATTADAEALTGLLADAFAEDLMWGAWAFPDPRERAEQRRTVFRLFVEGALRFPWVWVSGDRAATAVWFPPGAQELSAAQEEALSAYLDHALPHSVDRITSGFALIEAARPRTPHFYLSLLGSDPARAGEGLGLTLLRHTLALTDAEGVPAYLETSTSLVPFYERFGFNVVGAFALPDGPTVNTMWRPPSPRS